MAQTMSRAVVATATVQVLGTCAILAWVPTNAWKLAAFFVLWALSFRRVSRAEVAVGVVSCLIFTGMNVGALKQGVFVFLRPDVLGMPVWELFMWGFYVLHGLRFLRGKPPAGPYWIPLILAVAFSVPFSTIVDPNLLLLATGTVLLVAFCAFHERDDFYYAGYFVLLGAAIEYTGVFSGQWHYPANPFSGVPFWFVTMWGGVGLFVRRLLLRFVVGGSNGG